MKLQIPSTKLQRNIKRQSPDRGRAPFDLEIEIWSFSGAWMLVLGAF